jgi:AbiV family abortive infection protein
MSASVTPEYLLKGAVYALEQCGLLLRDAALLYRRGSYANAVVMAAFGREALGLWKILLAHRREVIDGKTLTLDEIKKEMTIPGSHIQRQKAGMLSITRRADREASEEKLLWRRITASPRKDQESVEEKLWSKIKERVPNERHKHRMSALYVEPVSLDLWNRPAKAISQTLVQEVVQEAMNDYSVQYAQRYITGEDPILKHKDSDLFNALEQWPGRPELARPEELV